MEEKIDKRLEPFIGNEPDHIGYRESFKGTDFLMPTEILTERMENFSQYIQEANSDKKELMKRVNYKPKKKVLDINLASFYS